MTPSISQNIYTADEIAALSNYKTARNNSSGQSYCFDLNALLEQAHWPDELQPAMHQTVLDLDSAFAKTPGLTKTTTVYRGDGHRHRFRGIETVDGSFRNLGYWSTSRSRERAIGFLNPAAKMGYGMLLELHLPIGLPAIDLETLEGAGGSEAEYLLPRGVLWTVKELRGPASGVDLFTQQHFTNIVEIVLAATPSTRSIG